MRYFSTNNRNGERISFREATLRGQAPDRGLYFPESIPQLPTDLKHNLARLDNSDIAYQVIHPYVGGEIPDDVLHTLCEETVNFEFPLVGINDSISSLELFHGPTMAFKDVGARFMSRCLGYFSSNNDKKVTILVATSGDTGSAVANGFLGIPGVEVVILYPSGKVSPLQEKQLTTMGRNITTLEVKGTFDDCQRMVKEAFLDPELNRALSLTSANSINIARWLPQQFYYFFALKQWNQETPPVFCVPSGNFGNLCAGLLAHASGMPAAHFIAACNANNVFPRFLETGTYQPMKSVSTYSNAMDVGDPSNFVRLLEIYSQDQKRIRSDIISYSISDETTLRTIQSVYINSGYLLEPHGAVGFESLTRYLAQYPSQKGILLETAHPVKFSEIVVKAIGEPVPIPEKASGIMQLQKQSILIDPEFGSLKEFLLNKN